MLTISAGHWGKGTGANGFLDEGVENIRVGKRVADILRSANIVTNYIQDTINKNAKDNVNWLVAQHNKTYREFDVQIHFNSSKGTHSKGIGVEVLVYGESMIPLAKRISKAISNVSGLIDRGGKIRKDLGFLRNTKKPAILIEVCFVNDSVDTAIYRRDFEKICQAIAKELASAVGKTTQSSSKNPPPAPLPLPSKKEEEEVAQLNETGRKEIRELLKKARNKQYIPKGSTTPKPLIDPSIHTDEKIAKYSDTELLSYQAAIVNRTFE